MKTFKELYNACVNNKVLIWNDPDPIEGNDYTISYIEDLTPFLEENDKYMEILIQYNNGKSEAQVFLHEILEKK